MGKAQGCTVGVTGSRAIRGAGSGLCPPPAKLKAVGVRQGRAASETEPLLLPRPSLRHVHGQPRCPGCVAPHFRAALRVASLELLRDGSRAVSWPRSLQACSALLPRPALPLATVRDPRPDPAGLTLALTTLQPGQELPFSQDRRRDCTPPPQLLLHLFQEPQDAQKMGTGQGLFSLQNLRG